MIHPHIELIQAEISVFTEEIEHLEAMQKERDLDIAEQHQKDIATACLEKYQATLAKLNDKNMVSKVNSYQDVYNRKKNEAQILFLLQFFYIVRLGQLGLFDVIEMEAPPKTMLNAITDVCDQLIGASVYHATEPSTTIKSQKRKQVADILKKLDTNSEDIILEDISYKDIKDLIQHVWDNTVNEAQVLENTLIKESAAKEWAVIQFENMVQSGEITPHIGSEHKDEVQQQSTPEAKTEEAQELVVPETKEEVSEQETDKETLQQKAKQEAPQQEPEPHPSNQPTEQQPSTESRPSPATDALSAKDNHEASAVNEWDKKDVSDAPVVNDWSKTQTLELPVVDEWDKKDTIESSTAAWDSNKDKLDTLTTNKEWTDASYSRKSARPFTKPNWKSNSRFSTKSKEPENWNANESRGWNNVIDNAVKADAWDNADTSATDDGADKNWTSSPSPPPAATKDKQQQPSDNWTSASDEQRQQQQKPAATDIQQQLQSQPQQVNTPPASPKLTDTKEQQQESYNSETNDNWRRRGIEDMNNSRGRGSSYRGGYRGSNRSGKFRGGGSSGGGRGRIIRGRGGRGRGSDFSGEEQHHSSPSQ